MFAAARADTRILGILCIVGAVFAFTLQDSVIKLMSGSYPLHEIVLGRAVVAALLTLVMARLEGGLQVLRTRRPGLHLARGMLLVVANMSYFLALAAMPLGEAAAVFFVAPLMITALSVPLLGERVGPRRWTAVLAGLAGVALVLRPGSGAMEPAALLPLLAASCYALVQITTRRLGVTDRASAMAFYVQLSFVLASGAIGLLLGDGGYAGGGHPSLEFLLRAWVRPGLGDGLLIVACGFLVAIGAYLASQAYRVGEANLIAPYEYAALPLAVLLGYLFWNDYPDLPAVLGILLIVGGGLFVFHREAVRGREVAVERPMPRNR
jgi:drug/metabolite transporter (DMT)-like permease